MSEKTVSFVPAPDVIATDLRHEMLLLDPRTGEMYVLNESGRCVWLSLPFTSIGGPTAALCAEFDVPQALAKRHAARLVRELRAARLVEVTVEVA